MRGTIYIVAVLVASAATPAGAAAARPAKAKERDAMITALERLLDKPVSASCVRGKVSSVSRAWGSLRFVNTARCTKAGQAGDGVGVYRRSGARWRYVESGPCEPGYDFARVPTRVERELLSANGCR